MKRIDPTERALDAYFELDTDQMAHFHAVIRYATRASTKLADESVPTPKRGRPAGSKNKKQNGPVNPLAPETFEPTALFARNAATMEEL